MEPKKLLLLILSILFGFIILIISFLAVIKYYPQAVGLPAPPQDTTKLANNPIDSVPMPIIPKIELKQYTLDSLNVELMRRNIDSNDRKAMIENSKYLLDSIAYLYKSMTGLQGNINKANDSLGRKSQYSAKLNDSLNKIFDLYQRALNEITANKEKIKSQEKMIEKKNDTLETKNFETFAKIYNGTNPVEVAKILEQIDERDAAKILKMMQKKKAGKVLEAMKPEHSAAILLLGAGN